MVSTSIGFDRAASYYDATRGLPPALMKALVTRLVAVAGLERISRVLEVGVGTGRIALPLSRSTGQYVGVDLSLPMLRVLREKLRDEPLAVVQGDAARLPIRDHWFDLAVCVHIFHLVGDWRGAIAELGRVVRPDGAVLIAGDDVPEYAGIIRRFNQLREVYGVPHDRALPGTSDLDLLSAALAEEGFTERADGVAAEYPRVSTPNRELARFAERAWTSTWAIPEPTFSNILADLRHWVASTFRDPDRPLHETGRWRYALFRRTSTSTC